MELDIPKTRFQPRPLRLGLLHAILAEEAVAGLEERQDALGRLRFRYGDDIDALARPPGFLKRVSKSLLDLQKIGDRIGGVGHGTQLTDGLRTRAAKLAAAAAALKRASGVSAPFSLAFMSDGRRIAHQETIIRALPKGAAVVFRDYDAPRRSALARRYLAIARARGVFFLVAGDRRLAADIGADGVHLPARMLAGAAPKAGDACFLTAACHGSDDLRRARALGADIAFLSPVFATRSHLERESLGRLRFRRLAATAGIPVLALGGVDETSAGLLAGPNVAGIAGIGAFLHRPSTKAHEKAPR
jgi:thiamine-phosphate pyrophosphorylase